MDLRGTKREDRTSRSNRNKKNSSNFGADMGVAAKIYYYGCYLFQYTASQGAVAELRPCLDPDFNTAPDLKGAYLHCDAIRTH